MGRGSHTAETQEQFAESGRGRRAMGVGISRRQVMQWGVGVGGLALAGGLVPLSGRASAERLDLNAQASALSGVGLTSPNPDYPIVAGVRVRLAQGWKTYWRNPGDSGIPPEFDFAASTNLAAVKVLWPAPKRFSDSSGTSIGYADDVVFPVLVRAEARDEPVRLAANLYLGICKDVCVPLEKTVAKTLAPDEPADIVSQMLIQAFLDRVPGRVDFGAQSPDAPIRLVDVTAVAQGDRWQATAEVEAKAGGPIDVFVTPPKGGLAGVPRAVPAGSAAGRHRFTLTIFERGAPGGVWVFTLIAGDQAIDSVVPAERLFVAS